MNLNSVQVKDLLLSVSHLFQEKRDELAQLDSIIGDGDHGISMARGAKAAEKQLVGMGDNEPVNEYFKIYGRTLIAEIGGAMGPLFGIIFTEFGKSCRDAQTFGKTEFINGVVNATDKVMDLGGAKRGDKTMVDGMLATKDALTSLDVSHLSFEEASLIAMQSSKAGLEATIDLMARRGRSKFLKEKSIGHPDAGATSFHYLMKQIHLFVTKKGDMK